MAKLNIGTAPKNQPKKKGLDKTYSALTDEQLSDMVNEMEKDEDEVEETGVKIDGVPVKVDEIRTIEDFNFNSDIIEAFKETFPNKKIMYRNKATNQFTDFYLDNCHSGNQLTDVKLNLLSDKQKEKFESEIDMCIAVDEVNDGLIKSEDQICDGFIISGDRHTITIDPTVEQAKIYEFILSEKWESREKGIIELDNIIREVISTHKTKPKSLTKVLEYLLTKFSLTTKANNTKLKVKEFIKPRDLTKAIIYFKHIEFLWKLLDDESLIEFKRELTEEEQEHIEKIRILREGHIV